MSTTDATAGTILADCDAPLVRCAVDLAALRSRLSGLASAPEGGGLDHDQATAVAGCVADLHNLVRRIDGALVRVTDGAPRA